MRLFLMAGFLLAFAVEEAVAQLNVELLHQLVAHNKDEEERQQGARNRQAVASANEEVNRHGMNRLKDRYRELQSRFHTLGLVLDAARIGIQATPIIDDIIRQQRRIIDLVADHPELVLVAAAAERDLVDHAIQLGRYLVGLLVSVGDINQMKASDRRILFSHIVDELGVIAGASRGLANTLGQYNRLAALGRTGLVDGFVNQDRQLVEEILRNAKGLRR